MKSLALLFLWNLIHKAVFSEVQDHSITCDPGSNWNNPKQVHHDSLKETHLEGPSLELESEDNESLYATDGDTHPGS